MYTEYIYSDRQYEIIEKNIKAYLFDIITKEQHKMADISSKLVSVESPELQDRIKELYMENDKCISSLLSLSSDLSDVIKKLDMVARNYNFMEDKNTPQLVANVSLNENNENKENGITTVDTNSVETDSLEKSNEEVSETVNTESSVVSIPNVNNQTSDEEIVVNDDVESVQTDVPVIGNIINTPNGSQEAENNEENSATITDVTPVAPVEVSETASPQIISNVDTSIDNSEEKLVFKKEEKNQAKAILTTGKQVTKLRESRDSQSSLLTAEGFFNFKDEVNQASTDEVVQVSAAGLLDQNTSQTTQQQIEQLMTQANELYQAGNVVESQKLYDQISQLNQSLKQNEAVLINK